MTSPIESEDEVTILDVYRLESQEISVDLSDGTSMTLTVHDILALRGASLPKKQAEQAAEDGAPGSETVMKPTQSPTTAIQLNPNDLHEE